ncbi:MAG: 2-hydroxyacid dehydrogenase [Actinomycetes bacterium]
MGRVVITRRLPAGGLTPLLDAGHEVVTNDDDRVFGTTDLVEAARTSDAIVCLLTDRIDAEVLEAGAAGGRLRVVANAAVGYDNIDVTTAARLGIVVTNTPDVLTETTADTTWLLILAARRLATGAEADLRAGRWAGWGFEDHLALDVHGARLGLVGYGRIGRAVARRAVAFGMDVVHHTRHDTGAPGWTADLDALLATADVVSLHVPLTDTTRHLIDRDRLARLKGSATLVNTTRGPVVDEAALAEALHAGRLFSAGLDVYEHEPIVHPDLLTAPRTVLLPHIGSATVGTRTAMAHLAATNAAAVLAGGPPPNRVTS